jgi:hypothetical protein
MARRGKSAGVLRLRPAGREAAQPLGGSRHAWAWKDGAEGRQLLRQGRGTRDTEQCWHRSSTRAHAPGTRRRPGTGPTRWRRLGRLIPPHTRRGASPRQGEGRDGRMEPAPATAAGHRRPGAPEAHRPGGHSRQSHSCPAPPVAGAGPLLRGGAGPRLLAGRAEGGGPWGGSGADRRLGRPLARSHRGPGTAVANAALPGPPGPTRVQAASPRPGQALRNGRARRQVGAPGLCAAVDGNLGAGCSRVQ